MFQSNLQRCPYSLPFNYAKLRLFDQLLWGFCVMWNQLNTENVVTQARKGHRKLDLIQYAKGSWNLAWALY